MPKHACHQADISLIFAGDVFTSDWSAPAAVVAPARGACTAAIASRNAVPVPRSHCAAAGCAGPAAVLKQPQPVHLTASRVAPKQSLSTRFQAGRPTKTDRSIAPAPPRSRASKLITDGRTAGTKRGPTSRSVSASHGTDSKHSAIRARMTHQVATPQPKPASSASGRQLSRIPSRFSGASRSSVASAAPVATGALAQGVRSKAMTTTLTDNVNGREDTASSTQLVSI